MSQLRVLLRTYFILSSRGKVAQVMSRGRTHGWRGTIVLMGLYVLIGLLIGATAMEHPDLFAYTLILHSVTFFLLGISLTAEAGEILFNEAEQEVLGPLPIEPRTLLLAKTLSLLAYTLLLGLALNLAPLFFGLAAHGAHFWFPVVHLLGVVGIALFCGAATVFLYALMVRLVSRERFDNVVVWSQVGLSVFFFFGYQLLPRLMRPLLQVDFHPYLRYLAFYPPAWFAGLDVSLAGRPERAYWLLAAGGLVVTGALSYAALARLSAGYAKGLSRLQESSTARPPRVRAVRRPPGRDLADLLRWWMRDPVERAAFRLATAYLSRDREIRLRLYPSLSMFLIFPVIGLLDSGRPSSKMLLTMTIWMLGLIPLTLLDTMRFSSQCAGAELFFSAPVRSSAPLYHGVRKAGIVCLMLPIAAALAVFYAIFWSRTGSSLYLILPAVIATPSLSMVSALTGEYLPLARPPAPGGIAARRTGLWFGAMASAGILAGLAYLAQRAGALWFFLAGEAVLVALLHAWLLRVIRRRPICAAG